MNSERLIRIIEKIADKIESEKEYLNDLDGAIGDADHGTNMARGFGEVKKKLPSLTEKEPSEILRSVGMTLISSVGGASGPLYGTAFIKASSVLKGKSEFDINDFSLALETAIEGVMARGRSRRGEKTMLDSMIPSSDALKDSINNGAAPIDSLKEALSAADDGVYYTKTIFATKGRASYLGARSIGHEDPGASSYKFILEAIYNEIKEQ